MSTRVNEDELRAKNFRQRLGVSRATGSPLHFSGPLGAKEPMMTWPLGASARRSRAT